jgi:hypothetical protein
VLAIEPQNQRPRQLRGGALEIEEEDLGLEAVRSLDRLFAKREPRRTGVRPQPGEQLALQLIDLQQTYASSGIQLP